MSDRPLVPAPPVGQRTKGLNHLNTRLRRGTWAQRDFLSRCAIFFGLSPRRLEELERAGRLVELSSHASLYRSGEPVRDAWLLCSGSVVRFQPLEDGGRRAIEVVQGPQLLNLGETFSATHYRSSCESSSRCILVAIDMRVLRPMISAEPALSASIIEALARRLSATETDSRGHHRSTTGAQRILDYLLEQAGEPGRLAGESTVTLNATKKVIASQVGLTPEAFSRSLRQLIDQGVLVVDKRNFHIQHAALLDTGLGDAGHRLSFARKTRRTATDMRNGLPPGALINLCGRLRFLSQQLAIASARLVWEIAPADARIRLRQFDGEFERTLARLRKLPLEAALEEPLAAVLSTWPAYRQALLSTAATAQDRLKLFRLSEAVLNVADHLTSVAAQCAGTPDARYVNVAGRNRMLSQRIGKLFLFRELVDTQEEIDDQISASIVEFDANLDELRQGSRRLPELIAQLDEVAQQWERFSAALAPDPSRMNRNRHARLLLAEGDRLLRYVDTAVKLYERLTK